MPKTTSAGESSVWSWDDGTPLEFDDETGAPLPPALPASEVSAESEVEPETGEVAEEPAPETEPVPADTRTIDEPPAWPIVDITPSGPPMDEPAGNPGPFSF